MLCRSGQSSVGFPMTEAVARIGAGGCGYLLDIEESMTTMMMSDEDSARNLQAEWDQENMNYN
jgi:hypothetical protein